MSGLCPEHKLVQKSTSLLKNLVPVQIKNVVGKLWKLWGGFGVTGFCSLPFKEMFVIAAMAVEVAISDSDDDDDDEEAVE